jgi:hypothetical protein
MTRPVAPLRSTVLVGGAAAMLAGPFHVPVPPPNRTLPPRNLIDPDSQFIRAAGRVPHDE